ncbi:hypothetical protein A2631_01345 [Candidatus Daviesbacteria bacterium RIFCSPHIGHO2_01_FULL_44_29]|uniref:Uncharacterized protein n=1 Tax=Candidatus Daviesbacteria bacterium RIFCSPHIGHO2_02_FULL_43_12 TaxID=1797776 RepID=A0A1F5KKS7_9BACT|nr:MAG: hypothetical protein A2631_01345 [Candidatus Daviesbacteria bacterium RIFCSPHIGHO2_01_FULL_44_29]OGE41536.1 MAG: hypothetical protein A3D25_00765 [Candidatus Daviesbacteria bacterium RIFCSPHIGHO2_02_FULL_43_12]OGE69818.1 MAG: hypothetical protein A3B55_05410 [Candidatus Daviesbacteria bacterium RIFCSPLOWO2_01_FULL_43_15]
MPFIDKKQLLSLYSSGLSMQQIALNQKVSHHKVAYWMKKYSIPSRSRSEAIYALKNPAGDPFKISDLEAYEDKELLALGIALYMGEGTKKDRFGVKLANSDPKIINLFLRFLRQVCGVKEEKIRAWINIFDDLIYKDSLLFWSNHTGILEKNFYSPVIRPKN